MPADAVSPPPPDNAGLPPRPDLDDRQRDLRARVHAACQQLADAGQRVSTRAARLAMGGGHPNDINPWVAEWKDLHQTRQRQLTELAALPDTVRGEILATLEPMVAQVWSIARGAAQAEVKRIQQAVADAQREQADELADVQALVEDLQSEKDALQAEWDAAIREGAAAEDRATVAHARWEDAQQATTAARAERDQLRAALAAAETAAAREAGRVEAKAQALVQLTEQRDALAGQLTAVEKDLAVVTTERDQLRKALAAAAERERRHGEALAVLTAERDQAQAAIDQGRETHQTAIAALREELATLRGQLLDQQQLKALLVGGGDPPSTVHDRPPAPAVTTAVRSTPVRAVVADPAAALQQQAQAALDRLVAQALDRWPALTDTVYQGVAWQTPTLVWYDRGQAAGVAKPRPNVIGLSRPLGLQDPQALLTDTLPHELAHLVADRLAAAAGQRIRPHGPQWQTVAQALAGQPLARTHTLDTAKVKARRTRYVLFLDPTNQAEHWISTRRAKCGYTFTSRTTGATLVRTPHQKLE